MTMTTDAITPVDTATPMLSSPMSKSAANKGAGPGGKHDNMRTYGPDEAQLVLKLVEEHAPRWTLIAKLVSDATGQERTAASIRNYYKRFTQSKAIAERDSDTRKLNRCQICGQIKRGHVCRPSSLTYVTPQTQTGVAPAEASALPTAPTAGAPLNLSGREEPSMPPLAPAALEVFTEPGASPLSTLSGPLSAQTFASFLGSPLAHAMRGLVPDGRLPQMANSPFAAFAAKVEYVVPVDVVPMADECEPPIAGAVVAHAELAHSDGEATEEGEQEMYEVAPAHVAPAHVAPAHVATITAA